MLEIPSCGVSNTVFSKEAKPKMNFSQKRQRIKCV